MVQKLLLTTFRNCSKDITEQAKKDRGSKKGQMGERAYSEDNRRYMGQSRMRQLKQLGMMREEEEE